VKNILLRKAINFWHYFNASPFSIIHSKLRMGKLGTDVSDFFAFRLDEYETIFIAENNLALFTARPIECKHIFHFIDDSGNACGVFEVNSEDFHYNLAINKSMTGGVMVGGFTHHIKYADNVVSQYDSLLSHFDFQHRGYTGFRKMGQAGFSYVHGNFGGLYFDKDENIKSLARLRTKHVYTPQFTIKPNYDYDFIFSNPVNRKIYIKFLLINVERTEILVYKCLAPFATNKFTFNQLGIENDCNISWETNFPVGRCVVFENNGDYFDVFHA
jgi:hypothetical protein